MVRTLPLGVDIGTTRVRLACTKVSGGSRHVASVATRKLAPGTATSGIIRDVACLSATIAEAWGELGTRERRCVLAVGMPDAQLHRVTFPRMSRLERDRIAVFEANRHLNYPIEEAVVRLHPIDTAERDFALGIVRAVALRSRLAALEASSLRPIAVDHEALALQRSLPGYDAVVDIGFERSSLHVFKRPIPVTLMIAQGGDAISHAIEGELAIDSRSAEKRKQTHGTSGAGEAARDLLIAGLAALMQRIDPRGHLMERVALVGNGARLHSLAGRLEQACGRRVDVPASAILSGGAYPHDVFAGAAPDWNLAAGLSLWGTTS